MKLWHGKKRLAKKMNRYAFLNEDEYRFFAELKPGEIFYGSDMFNHRLKRVEIYWNYCGNTRVIDSILLIDQNIYHYEYPCEVELPCTKEEIIQKWMKWTTPKGLEYAKIYGWSNFLSRLMAGEELLDDDGVLLNPDWRDKDD